MGISEKSFTRWKRDPAGDQRKGTKTTPHNKLDEQTRKRVIEVATSPEHRDKSPRQIVPKLLDQGEYVASESSFYRILKQEKMDAHRGRAKPKSRSKPKELIAGNPNEVWSWDITYLRSTVMGIYFYLYLVIDIYSRKIVGFELAEVQHSEISSKMIEEICKKEGIEKDQLHLHSDNGGPMKGATMLATLEKLGVMPSFSRPNVSDDNPFSESNFRTLKYCPMYPDKPFACILTARKWVVDFIRWYNNDHYHSGINYVTPGSRHEGLDEEILLKRKKVMEEAKKKNPERWSGKIRNLEKIKSVTLNKLKSKKEGVTKIAA